MIVDFHTHIGGVKSYHRNLKGLIFVTENDLLSYMVEFNIQQAVVLPAHGFDVELGEYIQSSENVLRICRSHPGLIPFCCIDPMESKKSSFIEDYVSKGARGYGEYKVKLPIDHTSSQEIYEICGKLKIPILMHIDGSHSYMFEEAFQKIAYKYNKTVFIMHGPGWWRHISAEQSREVYPTGPVKPGGLVDRILSGFENVYADISATSGFNALQRDRNYARGFLEKHGSKIVFGTDFPCIDPYGEQFGPDGLHLNLLKSLELSDKTLEAILFNNAERLLNLSQ
ncbi:amidohydrolase family protein [Candidatus Bathyarchaeota archaeon]|nr:amidohydrolase family protein [Candidatus Bathyarchaeota archaeon]